MTMNYSHAQMVLVPELFNSTGWYLFPSPTQMGTIVYGILFFLI